jgi:UDP-glucose 4-epimerase
MTTVLVAGGAGYIGSHTVKELVRKGYRVVVFDNLSSGRREFVRRADLIVADLMDREAIGAAFRAGGVEAVMHFASLIQVGESYANPRKYYTRNLVTSLNLLEAMLEADVRRFIFSSSAAVYGVPREIPITEDHPLDPFNPYGQTKATVERILSDYDRAHGLRYISLRYFNASGADPDGELGEAHDPETHLIPNIALALLGRKEKLEIFGTDFPTPDGTAVRDYIHVTDLAAAHVLALERLLAGHPSDVINLGTNLGYSVREVVAKAEEVIGRKVPAIDRPRREGDVPVLLASKDKAERVLGWTLRNSDLETILRTAWNWHRERTRRPAAGAL